MNRIAIAFAGAALVALAASPVSAQYPPPQGSVAITVSDPTPDVGATVTLSIVVSPSAAADLGEPGDVILASYPGGPADGQDPLLQAPPYSCTSSVSGGTGATVTPASFDTDSSGAATLSVYTGTTPGVLTVGVDCGTASGQAILTVGGGAGDGTATVPAPPGAGGGATTTGPTPRPPATGSGEDGSMNSWTIAAGGMAGLVIAAGAAYVALRGKGRRA